METPSAGLFLTQAVDRRRIRAATLATDPVGTLTGHRRPRAHGPRNPVASAPQRLAAYVRSSMGTNLTFSGPT
jgi:hypothetical protein